MQPFANFLIPFSLKMDFCTPIFVLFKRLSFVLLDSFLMSHFLIFFDVNLFFNSLTKIKFL